VIRDCGSGSGHVRARARGQHPSPGRAGSAVVPEQPTGTAARPAQLPTGQPPRYTVPVHLFTPRGRPSACHRRGRSPSIVSLATTPMVRRWAARGMSRGGPEGRRSWTPGHAEHPSHLPVHPTVSRTRDPNRHETEGGPRPTLRRRAAKGGPERGRGVRPHNADAGPPAALAATDQKAGAPGSHRHPVVPWIREVSR